MSNKARYVKPKSPERVQFEQSVAVQAEKPKEITLEMIYKQLQQVIENQAYIVSLLTRKRP